MLSAGVLMGPSWAAREAQSDYPTKPVRVVVPFGPGGIADTSLRIVAEKLTGELGQQVIVENQPGAGGIIAANEVLKSEADGYTLAFLTNGTAISVPLFKKLPFDPLTDFTPVSTVSFFDFVLVTNAQSPFRTVADVVMAARDKPGGLNLGTINVGSSQNLSAELLKSADRRGLRHRPLPADPGSPGGGAAERRRSHDRQLCRRQGGPRRWPGTCHRDHGHRALAGAARRAHRPGERHPILRGDVLERHLRAHGHAEPRSIATMNRALQAVLATPDVKQRMLDLGVEARASTPDELRARLQTDIAKWGEVIAKAGIEQQ